MAGSLTYEAQSGLHPNASAGVETTCALLDRARQGDSDALNTLFSRHLGPLRQWARGRLPRWARDLSDTQDLVQETALQAFRKIDGFQPRHDGALQAYLREAVRNRIRNEFRRAGRHPAPQELHDNLPLDATSPLQAAVRQEQQERYRLAMARLVVKDRDLLIARLEAGLGYEKIAALFGKPSANAARMAIARALLRLVDELAV